eukprot:8731328-Karenia_brevis.AAC.1
MGGDLNAITGNLQVPWSPDNPLDPNSSNPDPAQRTSADRRATSAHGHRLLEALADLAIIFNGIT